MTISLPRTAHIGAVAAALVYTTATFGALVAPAPASARSVEPYYMVELAQPVETRTTTIAGGVAWTCKGTTCVASKASSRPLRVCRELNRQHGTIANFIASGETLDAEKLAKCND